MVHILMISTLGFPPLSCRIKGLEPRGQGYLRDVGDLEDDPVPLRKSGRSAALICFKALENVLDSEFNPECRSDVPL